MSIVNGTTFSDTDKVTPSNTEKVSSYNKSNDKLLIYLLVIRRYQSTEKP